MLKKEPKLGHYQIHPGMAEPLGATYQGKFWNFALFSEHAEEVLLCLFTKTSKDSILEIPLQKTGHIWHVALEGDLESLEYGYRLKGKGNGFDFTRVFLDPYARYLNTPALWGSPLKEPILGILKKEEAFDWKGDLPPRIPLEELIIYEMHVRSFTIDSSSHVKHPGSFLGILEKIPYLKKLGINAIELMPIFEFNENEILIKNPLTQENLRNVWGYSTLNFFTPMPRFASHPGHAFFELCTLVKECHKNGIEVFLDVVYNHTGEGKIDGPSFSFKGIDRDLYYMMDEKGQFENFSGTGNTFNCNHPMVIKLILDSLKFWVTHAHIDGFRFDLASILTRGVNGKPLENPPLIERILSDPILSSVKLIAEAWDAGGLYQVGSFPGKGRFLEWNGKYRDAVRKFIKGTDSTLSDFATALCGSSSLYDKAKGSPCQSINFITAHDGYTLHDLVSYQEKHNLANGENNQDGASDNESWNCGVEGETTDPKILSFREKQMKNFLTALFVSIGIPMFLMGDEYQHTRFGNNNAWCQDNTLNFFLWGKNPKWTKFCHDLIAFRKREPLFKRTTFLTPKEIDWHGKDPFKPNWDPKNRFIAYTLKNHAGESILYIAFHAGFEAIDVHLPPLEKGKRWHQVLNTSLSLEETLTLDPKEEHCMKSTYHFPAYSALILKAF